MNGNIDSLDFLIKQIYGSKLYRLFRDLNEGMEGVLNLLYDKEFLYASEIAKKMNLTKARLSCLIKRLVFKLFVKVEIEQDDKRKYRIYITKLGKDFVKFKKESYAEELNKLLQKISEKELNSLALIAGENDEVN